MKKLFTALLLMFLSVQAIEAQGILNRVENRAKQKLNERIERKVDQKIDQQLDKVFESDSTNSDSVSFGFRGLSLPGSNSKCKVEKEYSYHTEFVMDMYSVGKKDKDSFSMTMSMYFENNGFYFGMKLHQMTKEEAESVSDMVMIFNLQDSCMISLMEVNQMKMGFAISYKDQKDTSDASQIEFKKTGKSKTILGQTCHEYVGENEETKQTHWVSEKDSKVWDVYLKNGFNAMPKSKAEGFASMQGYPLEAVIENKKEKSTTYMYVREIKTKQEIKVSTEGYSIF